MFKDVFKTYIYLWNKIFHFRHISCIIPTRKRFMAKREVLIHEDEQYITLNVLLKITGLISTGGEAKFFLANNDVFVNGEKENRRGRKLYREDVIKTNKDEFVIK